MPKKPITVEIEAVRFDRLRKAEEIVKELATCKWQGKDATTARLITESRKLCGWKRKDVLS